MQSDLPPRLRLWRDGPEQNTEAVLRGGLCVCGIVNYMDKKIILVGMFIGSIVGGYVPVLFGSDSFSFTSIFGSIIGGSFGIWFAYRFVR